MRVAVIGCGPAGLAAAHAAVGLGAVVTVYAPKKMRPQLGPIMLHRPIPGINKDQPDGYVRQLVVGGSILDYRYKLYGDINISINGDILEHGFATWRVPETYQVMWDQYEKLIIDGRITRQELRKFPDEYDLVICTAPANRMCFRPGEHEFRSKAIAITPYTSYPDQPPDTVIYNAYPDVRWVRSSWIFDAQVTEWEPANAPDTATLIQKPLSHTCDCHPRVFRTGRYGAWHNETWIDHAYFDTFRIITSMLRRDEWEKVT